jgi:hypothetical protein
MVAAGGFVDSAYRADGQAVPTVEALGRAAHAGAEAVP